MTTIRQAIGQDRHPMSRLAFAIAAAAATTLAVTPARAAPAKKKFHFELTAVTPKSDVKADVAKAATPRVEAQVKKVFETHPQLVAKLDGAPDPRANADGYRQYLARKSI